MFANLLAAPVRLGRAASRHYIVFLTLRYLLRRPLALVAIIALALAIACLVVAPSVMNGFQAEFHGRVRGTLSDVRVWSEQPFAVKRDAEYEAQIGAIPGVTAVAPYLETPALDKHLTKMDYCFLQGVEPSKEEKVSDFARYVLSPRGEFLELNDLPLLKDPEAKERLKQAAEALSDKVDLPRVYKLLEDGDPEDPGTPTCLVGIHFLRQYDLDVMADPTASSIGTIRLTTASDNAEVKQDTKVRVIRSFQTGFYNNDRRFIYMSLRNAQKLVGAPDRISGYSIKLEDYKIADQVKQGLGKATRAAALAGSFPRRFLIRTWEEKDENLLRAVRMEKLLIRIITGLIVAAASASIFLVLIMSVYTKVRELGILRAVGGGRFGVFLLFLGQGLLIATVAMGVGCVLGVSFSLYINEIAKVIHRVTGFHPFPPDVYYLERIPTKIVPMEIVEDFGITLAFACVFGFIPAFIAALRPPIRAIRYE